MKTILGLKNTLPVPRPCDNQFIKMLDDKMITKTTKWT